jgi:DNA helicase HerA-like ATPase
MPDDFAERVQKGYATKGPAPMLGVAVRDGAVVEGASVKLPLAMMNRHGLIAGATGTGKTKTLQLLAEQLSDAGVPVFAGDVKGDVSGISQPGDPAKVEARVKEVGIDWDARGFPVAFLSLGGQGPGVPVRATVSSFGPQLLAKVLDVNDTQTSSLTLVFRYADQAGLPLLDLADLRAVLQYLTSKEGKSALEGIGGVSKATAGVLQRAITELQSQGADAFFGEPELAVSDLLQTTADGKGVVNCLELVAVQAQPRLYSTFLMWLLAELFEHLPEVGDLDKPKLVFFFDEAHLLFEGASKPFLEEITQTVRLIRSKGVGVFFITQLPDDIQANVLAQLGNRVQHALRAFTPRDAKALKAAVSTYPNTADYDLEEALTQLGIGEAIVTILSDRGAPTPVVWTRMIPPHASMAAVPPDEIDRAAKASPLWGTYGIPLDRESAREMLAAKMGQPAPAGAPARPSTAPERDAPVRRERAPKREHREGAAEQIGDFLKSREGRATVNSVVRGVFGLLKKKR